MQCAEATTIATNEVKPKATAVQVKSMEELVSFLSHQRPEIRKSASSLLIGITATDQGIYQLLHLKDTDVVQALCRVVSDMRPIAEDAIKALINLTAGNPNACERAVKNKVLTRVMNQLEDDEWRLKDFSMMLLANVTTTPEGAKALLGYSDETQNDLVAFREKKIRTLTNLFLDNEPEPEGLDKATGEPKWDDEYQYVASILANISQLEQGRSFLLKHRQPSTLVQALLPQLNSPNVVRRRGIASMLRNLCFDTDSHFLLYDHLDSVSKLMFLLAGPEPLDQDEKDGMHPSVYRLGEKKKREHDAQVRLAAVETLLLLCTTRNGRNDLRKKKVYPIVRNAHLVESDEEIGDQIYKLVGFLIRDEEEPDWNAIRQQAFAPDDDKTSSSSPSPATKQPQDNHQQSDTNPTASATASTTESTDASTTIAKQSTAASAFSSDTKPIVKPPQTSKPGQEQHDETLDDQIAAQVAQEISLLDVSSDDEEEFDAVD